MSIYFDHSATTPLDPQVLKEMLPYFTDDFGNASSIHSFGQRAQMGIDTARSQVASFLNCETDEVVFTSGATESDNLALYGAVKAAQKAGVAKPHIISTSIEHDAILEPAKDLSRGLADITLVPVNGKGQVSVDDVIKAITDNTILVSVMYVNSEVGSIQPIVEIGRKIKKINDVRIREWEKRGGAKRGAKPIKIIFHTDATQALNFLDCNVAKLNVDLLSLSAHKIYGPKGVGALFVRKGASIMGVTMGGQQERNFRSGTLNVPGIVGLGKAISLITKKEQLKNNKYIEDLRDMLVAGILSKIDKVALNTPIKGATPAHAHFSFLGIEGESILMALDLEADIAISTGAACASKSLKSSHVLLAMGVDEETSHYSVRFTLGKNNTAEEIEKVIEILPGIIKRFREISSVSHT